jgi:hypothetical protein
LLNQQTSRNSPNGGGIGDLCGGGGEDTTELGEVQELGTEILEMILEQVFGAADLELQSSPKSTTAQLL